MNYEYFNMLAIRVVPACIPAIWIFVLFTKDVLWAEQICSAQAE